MSRHLRFGMLTMQGPPWSDLARRWREYDALGFDHGWLCDHFVGNDGEPRFEAWTLLAALALATDRIRLGVSVTCMTFRHPALLAKEAVAVDHLSNGRLELGLGAGWWAAEHDRYGIPFPSPPERVARFREYVEVVDRLLRADGTTTDVEGRFTRLQNAEFLPAPVQRPRPPLVLGAQGPRMLDVAAAHADTWMSSFGLSANEVEVRNHALDERCAAIGRDPAVIRRAFLWAPWVQDLDPWSSPEAFVEFVDRYRDAGVTDFIFDEPHSEQRAVFERVATEVIPALREGSPG